jgi:hypothetical protein
VLCCVFVHGALVRVEQQLMCVVKLVNTTSREFVFEGARGVEVNNLCNTMPSSEGEKKTSQVKNCRGCGKGCGKGSFVVDQKQKKAVGVGNVSRRARSLHVGRAKLTVLLLRTFSFLKIYRGYPTSFDLSHHLNPHIIGTQRLDNGLLYRICSIDCPLDCPSLPSSLPSHSQHVEAPRQAVHRIANLSKHPHSARPSLDVLAQPTKRRKLDSAIRLGASVDLVLMTRAFQVLIEMCKRPIRRAAQKALERRPIP